MQIFLSNKLQNISYLAKMSQKFGTGTLFVYKLDIKTILEFEQWCWTPVWSHTQMWPIFSS